MGSRSALLALLTFVFASAYIVQGPGFNQNAHYALVRALADGTAVVDEYRAETGDVSFFEGHYYAAKAPGLAFANLPVYLVLDGVGIVDALRPAVPPLDVDPGLTRDNIAVVWLLGLWSALLPALGIGYLVMRIADELEPGFGLVAAAATLLATLLLPFSELLFAHSLSAFLGFGGFALLWWRRPAAIAGVLAGLAVVVEYPLALVAAGLAVYALGQGRSRAAAFVGGAVVGVLPLVAFNSWAFGSPTHIPYENAVSSGGVTGHDELAANEPGLFGVRMPSLDTAGDLLFSHLGLLVVAPVTAIGAAALALLWGSGRRRESALCGGLLLAFLVYNAGYLTPFGGGSPGPRFLVPVLPFLGLPLALAWRRWPAVSAATAFVSLVLMALMSATVATHARDGFWDERIVDGDYASTVVSYAGVPRWIAIWPYMVALAAAAFLAYPRAARLESPPWRGYLAILAWATLALVGPRLFTNTQLGEQDLDRVVVLVAGAAAVALWALSHVRNGRYGRPRAPHRRPL